MCQRRALAHKLHRAIIAWQLARGKGHLPSSQKHLWGSFCTLLPWHSSSPQESPSQMLALQASTSHSRCLAAYCLGSCAGSSEPQTRSVTAPSPSWLSSGRGIRGTEGSAETVFVAHSPWHKLKGEFLNHGNFKMGRLQFHAGCGILGVLVPPSWPEGRNLL